MTFSKCIISTASTGNVVNELGVYGVAAGAIIAQQRENG